MSSAGSSPNANALIVVNQSASPKQVNLVVENPCLTSNGGCDYNAACINNGGAISCLCNPGFTSSNNGDRALDFWMGRATSLTAEL